MLEPDVGLVALGEVGLHHQARVDAAHGVHSSDEVRRARAAQRGHTMVEERETRHLRAEEKARRADHVVSNDGTIEELEAKLSALVESLTGSGQAAGPDQLQQ